jgi:hypothetical protein
VVFDLDERPKRELEAKDLVASNQCRSIESQCLRKVEGALAFLHSSVEPGAQDVDVAVVGHLEVVDASHDGRKELIRSVGRLCRLADDGEHGRERFEACERS